MLICLWQKEIDMFGLEKNKKEKAKPDDFVFELEKELLNSKKHKEIKGLIEGRIQKIKDTLRAGDSKEEFDHFGIILHGYTSLLKVMSRFNPK